MILQQMDLFHFRQFRGHQSIEFAIDPQQNVSVIYGENGRGKTGIFRALMFCLYGEKSLSQDELTRDEKKEGLLLVNELELRANKGSQVETQVIIRLLHNNESYKITRKTSALITADENIIKDHESVVELVLRTADGNTCPAEKDPERISLIIQDILNSRLRDYFLFDGERIERLTRNTRERREEVQKGIRALLDLDALELAKNGLKKLFSSLDKDIKNKSTGKLQVITGKIDELNELIEKRENEQEIDQQELRRLEHRTHKLSQQISDNEETAELEKKRKEYVESQENKKIEKDSLKQDMGFQLNISPQFIVHDLLEQLLEELDLRMEKGELPPAIRKEFIEKLLQDEKCICGTSLDENHSDAKNCILEFLEKKYIPGLDEKAQELLGTLNKISGGYPGWANEFNRLLLLNKKLDDEILELENKINQLDEQLGDSGTNIDDLIQERINCKKDKKSTEHQIDLRDIEIKNREEERDRLRKSQKALGIQEKQIQILISRQNLTHDTQIELESIYNHFAKSVRTELEEKSTEIFYTLADDETKKDIKRLSIDENYMLDVLNWTGQRRLGEISAGQRQIVSLSFIMALIHVAGNLEVPLFMDTPFGRLSGVHRDHLLGNIPLMASQWILLVTDTEFTVAEATALKKTGRWGKIYELKKEQEGATEIVCRDLNSFIPKRKSAA